MSDQRSSAHRAPVGWLFVAGQVVLLAAIVFLPGPRTAAPDAVRSVGLVLEVVGIAIVVWGAAQLGPALNVLPTPNRAGDLRTGGLYRLVRHPIYFGVLVFAAGATVRGPTWARLVAALALIALLRGKAAWEERRLAEKFPDYAEYAARTPAIVPLPFHRRRSDG